MPPRDPSAPKVRFDWTVNLGHILSAGTFLIAASVAWADLRNEQLRLRDDIGRDRERLALLERSRERDDRETSALTGTVARMAAQIEFLWNRAQQQPPPNGRP